MAKISEISDAEAESLARAKESTKKAAAAKKAQAAAAESSVLTKLTEYWWNVYDWTVIGCRTSGVGLWILGTAFVVMWLPLRRAYESELMFLEQLHMQEQQQKQQQQRSAPQMPNIAPPR